jgi:hypothetical protein
MHTGNSMKCADRNHGRTCLCCCATHTTGGVPLGIVIGWDPHQDSTIESELHTAKRAARTGPQDAVLTEGPMLKVMVCVSESEPLRAGCLTKADAALLSTGHDVTAVLRCVGSLTTAAREYAAVRSVPLLQPYLQSALLAPAKGSKRSATAAATAAAAAAARSAGGSGSSRAGAGAAVQDLTVPPGTVPPALWRRLSEQYNESQLSAVKAVAQGSPTGFTLLQGPPGTGVCTL